MYLTRTETVLVLLASGRGVRSSFDKPKQFVNLAGIPVLQYALLTASNAKTFNRIIVVASEEHLTEVKEIAQRIGVSVEVIIGGAERWESSYAAICFLKDAGADPETKVLFHDSVRPLVTKDIFARCVAALEEFDAVDTVIPSTDTIIQSDESKRFLKKIPNRSKMFQGQTPQGFRLRDLALAYDDFLKSQDRNVTDDCAIFLRAFPEKSVGLVMGSPDNMKLTYEKDLHILDKLIQLKTQRESSVVQIPKGKRVIVFGGSSGIGHEICNILKKENHVYSASRSSGCNVRNRRDIVDAIKKAVEVMGGIDFVINSAGILYHQTLKETSESEILELIEVNYLANIWIAKEAYSALRESKGMLLLFTSSSYSRGRANYSIYSSSKAAIVNLVQGLSEEWLKDEIRVNAICPSRTNTPMRTKNFGNEPPDTLLSAVEVANTSVSLLEKNISGVVIDLKK